MKAREVFRGLIHRRPRVGTPSDREDDIAPSSQELRQRRLMHLRRRGLPLWSEEPEHCDGCGRVLLVGERGLLVQRGDTLALACPLCAEELLAEGYQRVVCGSPEGSAGELPLAG